MLIRLFFILSTPLFLTACFDFGESSPSGKETIRDGAEIYASYCVNCHAGGTGGAPRVGEKFRLYWSHEIEEEGFDIIVQEAINGVNAMPPRGGCADCSDEEIRNAVIHMLQLSAGR